MRYRALLFTVAVAVPLGAGAEVNRLKDVPGAIAACWVPPASLERLEVTVRFSLDRQGKIIGRPAITFSLLGDNEVTNREFIVSVLNAIAQCTPVDLSSSFAEAFAGRPMAVRFVWDKQRKSLIPRAI
jgi:hypothetical protein